MHDLRKKALLESGKTTSRKARSKTTTPSSSRANSRVNSRNGSRNVSDDEGELSDTTQWSSHSIDELIASVDADDLPQEAWIADLEDRISEICDRKRSSAQGREETLQHFNVDLTRHFAHEEIAPKLDDLLPHIMKSIKSGHTERETVLALRALSLILITSPSEKLYDAVADTIKGIISDAEHAPAKIAALRTLSIASYYGGATEEEIANVMAFYLEIVSSDGAAVDEEDNAEVVAAASEEWGFLATRVEDLEEATEDAMETFIEQLQSSDAHVLKAAGENIALLFEKSYTEAESDDDAESGDVADGNDGEVMVKRYTAYRNLHQLSAVLTELAKASSKRLSKADKKMLHRTFTDILHTIEKPTRGPRYSTALDIDGNEYGSRLKIRVTKGGTMLINSWWKYLRLEALKRLLQGGFGVHFERNANVFDTLPVDLDEE